MFHDVRFPLAISRASHGGPERRTDVVVLGSGAEERNARWANSRRSYNAGWGVKSLDDLYAVIAFFEERRGRLYGFRWRDPLDHASCLPSGTPSATDQDLGTGATGRDTFQLVKTYGAGASAWIREINKPTVATVRIAVAGISQTEGRDFTVDTTTGRVTFLPGKLPPPGAAVTAGFEFDVPVRFDTDRLEINLDGFKHGAIPAIPLVEIRL
jgi:uncharacterized protein (TIGR02217 family)